jgi:hypothetical protein
MYGASVCLGFSFSCKSHSWGTKYWSIFALAVKHIWDQKILVEFCRGLKNVLPSLKDKNNKKIIKVTKHGIAILEVLKTIHPGGIRTLDLLFNYTTQQWASVAGFYQRRRGGSDFW